MAGFEAGSIHVGAERAAIVRMISHVLSFAAGVGGQ
jgi:hypothetical protein